MRAAWVIILVAAVAAASYFGWQQFGAAPGTETVRELSDPSTERFVEVAGATVRVREEGPEGAPVILLLHGFSFSLETWDAWAEALSASYRVVRYDLLGHGETGPDPFERYAPAQRAAFIADVMDALGHEQVILGGNSLGGLAAWRFAANNPERVGALILVSPGAYPINGVADEPVPVPPAVALYLRAVPEMGLRASLKRIYADPGVISEERIETIGEKMRRPGNGEAMVRSLEEFVLPDPTAELANVEAPTLVLWGEADQVIPPSHGQWLVDAIPNAELITYPGVGHVAHEERPEATLKDVEAFLDQQRGM
ncbi:MAG: alpha/beta hydrolase [Pseudomonadota bacterium]